MAGVPSAVLTPRCRRRQSRDVSFSRLFYRCFARKRHGLRARKYTLKHVRTVSAGEYRVYNLVRTESYFCSLACILGYMLKVLDRLPT
jgi:hypothetical protein